MIKKSIIENFELATGSEVYVQASGVSGDNMVISFDGSATNFGQYMKISEAEKLAEILIKVAKEAKSGIL